MPRGQLSREKRLEQQVTRLKNLNQRHRKTITELKAIIKQQDKRIRELQEKIEDKEAQRKQLLSYLYKPNKKKGTAQPRGKKPGAPGYQRPKPKEDEVTETHAFTMPKCPSCRITPLGKPTETVVKYEEDIDLAPRKIIIKYLIARYWCSKCQEFVRSPDIPPITRIGPNVMGYILYARYRLRLPQAKIKESLEDLHNFVISDGEVAEKLQEAERLFGKDYRAIAELIKAAKIVYADETGWRMEGENWWLWVFKTNKGVRYVIEDTRGKGVPEKALGTKKDRVIISDGYKVYDNLPGDNQQCWVHLLRVARDASPTLHEDLVRLYVELGEELLKPLSQRDPPFFTQKLQTIIEKDYSDLPAKKAQERIVRHQKQLLTCLSYEGVLPENNTAERALRNHVVMRKIFGGSRSPDGAHAHEVNTSVIDTMIQQNPDSSFFDTMLPLIKKRIEEKQGRTYDPPSAA